jgi:hypothetical protein
MAMKRKLRIKILNSVSFKDLSSVFQKTKTRNSIGRRAIVKLIIFIKNTFRNLKKFSIEADKRVKNPALSSSIRTENIPAEMNNDANKYSIMK